jgi:hypothetical protein
MNKGAISLKAIDKDFWPKSIDIGKGKDSDRQMAMRGVRFAIGGHC